MNGRNLQGKQESAKLEDVKTPLIVQQIEIQVEVTVCAKWTFHYKSQKLT